VRLPVAQAVAGRAHATRLDVVEDKAGNLFVATGDEGKIFKSIPTEGHRRLRREDSQILCLVAAADGQSTLHRPSGLIVRIDPTVTHGAARTPRKNTSGACLRRKERRSTLQPGRGKSWPSTPRARRPFSSRPKQDHILSLVRPTMHSLRRDRQTGLIYRIDAKEGFVLFQASQPRWRCLHLTATPCTPHQCRPGRAAIARRVTVGSVSAPRTYPDASRVSETEKRKPRRQVPREERRRDKGVSASAPSGPTRRKLGFRSASTLGARAIPRKGPGTEPAPPRCAVRRTGLKDNYSKFWKPPRSGASLAAGPRQVTALFARRDGL